FERVRLEESAVEVWQAAEGACLGGPVFGSCVERAEEEWNREVAVEGPSRVAAVSGEAVTEKIRVIGQVSAPLEEVQEHEAAEQQQRELLAFRGEAAGDAAPCSSDRVAAGAYIVEELACHACAVERGCVKECQGGRADARWRGKVGEGFDVGRARPAPDGRAVADVAFAAERSDEARGIPGCGGNVDPVSERAGVADGAGDPGDLGGFRVAGEAEEEHFPAVVCAGDTDRAEWRFADPEAAPVRAWYDAIGRLESEGGGEGRS